MSQAQDSCRLQAGGDAQRSVKKPYQRPEVRHEQVFETRALTCGKVQTTQGSCHFERKHS